MEKRPKSKYCYHCGALVSAKTYCSRCGADLNPPWEVYCDALTCSDYDCGADVPRWGNYCPVCGKAVKRYNPGDMEARASRHRGLILGAFVWSGIFIAAAAIISFVESEIPLKYAMIVAAVIVVIIWLSTLSKWERGKIIDGTVTRHWTEASYESIVVPGEKTLLGNRQFEKRPITLYKTEIQWDDGGLETRTMQDCAANHIQLSPGDRVRKFISTGEFFRI